MLTSEIGVGDWPGWIAAAGTLLAVVFAGFAALAAMKTNQQQTRQLEMLAADQQRLHRESIRQQATEVAVWWKRGRVSDGPQTRSFTVYVMNASSLPIYNCAIDAKIKTEVGDHLALQGAWKAGWENATGVRSQWHAGPILLPQRAAHVFLEAEIDTRGLSERELGRLDDDVFIIVSLTFRDAKGTWWLASSRGDLRESKSPMGPRPDFG